MSLIQCEECREKISSKAIACPKCGAPLSNASCRPQNRGIIIIAAILVLSGSLLGFRIYRLQAQADQEKEKAKQKRVDTAMRELETLASKYNIPLNPNDNRSSPQPLVISVRELYEEAKSNPTRATSKYKGMRWTFTGKVQSILGHGVFLSDKAAIAERTATVFCGFGHDPSAVNSLNKQQDVKISGEITMLTDVELTREFVVNLDNCRIE